MSFNKPADCSLIKNSVHKNESLKMFKILNYKLDFRLLKNKIKMIQKN